MHLTELNLKNADKEFVWHPYTQMRDWVKWNNRVIVKGDGFYLVDSEGRKYLDGSASMWCNVWGHTQNEVVQAMIRSAKKHPALYSLWYCQCSVHKACRKTHSDGKRDA